MEAPESDELSTLMPNLRQAAQRASSPGETVALREYIKVLGEKPTNVPAGSTLPHKPRTDGLQLRAGTGRRPQRRYFTIKWRPEDLDVEQRAAQEAAAAAALDPEALKDALVEQARAQRHALVEASLRPGTGRVPRPREFAITLPLLCQEEDKAAEAAALAEAEAAEAEAAAFAAAEEQQQLLENDDGGVQWEAEEGVLAEANEAAWMQPADATPGAVLWQQQQQQQDGQPASAEQQQADSQRAQAKTPASSLFGRYTPMEGVPERLALLAATRGKQLPATVSRLAAQPALMGTPAGFTPLEGIPERLHGFAAGPRALDLPGVTRVYSNEAEAASVDSPVEGLVQQGGRRSRCSGDEPLLADVEAGFAGFAPPPPPEEEQQAPEEQHPLEEEQQQEWDDDDDVGGGMPDDGGFDDIDGPSPGAGAGFPLLVEAGMQTGTSLGQQEEAALAAASAGEMPLDGNFDGGFDGGGDAGGDFGGLDDYEQPHDADVAETSAAAQKRARKQNRNPGSRLRNELKRKSLAADRFGMHTEGLGGVRRSGRQKQEPLKWWLNEKKEFGREHQTMPTVRDVVHKVPNTPWQMVSDIRRKPAKKQRQRAPTPHNLGDALAAEEEEQQQQQEEEEVEEVAADEEQEDAAAEEQEEEGEEEQPQQQRRSGRQQQAAAEEEEQQRGRRQQPSRGRAAKAAALPARGKATKKKAAGSKRQGRR